MRGWLTEALAERSCAGLLVLASSSRDADLAAFTGSAHLGEAFVLWPSGTAPLLGYLTPMERDEALATGLDLLGPEQLDAAGLREEHGAGAAFWAQILDRACREAGLAEAVLAVAGRPELGTVHAALTLLGERGWSFVDGSSLLKRWRKEKSAAQVAAARQAAAGACAALRSIADLLARSETSADGLSIDGEPLAAGHCRREIAAVLAAHGLEQPEGNIVSAGADAAVPHTRGSDERRLRAGETIVVDIFPRGRVFADCTRTFVVGEPSAVVAAAHESVASALAAAHGWARTGRRGWELQERVCERLADAGYRTPLSHPGTLQGYVHGLGHGVGFELHEYPSFARAAGPEGIIERGDLLTLEPGLYDPDGGWGIRLEDLCLVTADGLENLTPLPYDLDPRRWPGPDETSP